MTPLRVVLVLLEPPLPFGNAAARWYYVLLKGLVERGHRVTALAACSKVEEAGAARELFPPPRYDLRCFPFPRRAGVWSKVQTLRRPFSYMFSQEFKDALRGALARGFHVLHLEQLWSGWAALPWRRRALVNIHYLNEIDAGDEPPAGWRGWLERRLMLAAERRLLRSFARFRTLSDRLAQAVALHNPTARIDVVPIGLDPGLYRFIPEAARPAAPVVGLIGNMNWRPSHSAAVRLLTRLWPEVRRRVPAARVHIVGWGARRALGEFLGLPGVTIEEDVPDPLPWFERTGVLLYAPRRGSGMKIKVLEALALGVPVVTTSEGVEGLPAQDGVHAGVSEDDAGLIERTVRLLQSPESQDRQRRAGRALLEAHCGPGPTLDALEAIYASLAGGRPQAEALHAAGRD
jgi:glycosyltransferase involved in cell wall biosynthesis